MCLNINFLLDKNIFETSRVEFMFSKIKNINHLRNLLKYYL